MAKWELLGGLWDLPSGEVRAGGLHVIPCLKRRIFFTAKEPRAPREDGRFDFQGFKRGGKEDAEKTAWNRLSPPRW